MYNEQCMIEKTFWIQADNRQRTIHRG
jgi:hypothetical protein